MLIQHVYALGIDQVNPKEVAELNKAMTALKGDIDQILTLIVIFSLLTSILAFIIHFVRLGAAHSHPLIRKEIFKDIGVVGLSVTALSGLGLLGRLLISSFL